MLGYRMPCTGKGLIVTGEEFRAALHSGRRVYGSAVTTASVSYLGALKELGLDWVFIDNEHAAIGRESTAWLCRAYAAAGIVPVVRIPFPEPTLAAMALDGGAQAVIVPYVEDPEVVRRMVGTVKLRPLKGRRQTDLLDGGPGLDARTPAYLRARNAHASLIVNVESVPALERLDEICSVDGLDAVLIGPHDLSVSLDVPEQYDHPRFLEATLRILRTARAHNLGAGIHHWHDLDQEQYFIRESGANLIAHSFDLALAVEALRPALHTLRTAFGDLRATTGQAGEVI
jgi:4-hydroxy-2-oxoheptanedioate aldolase